MQKLVTGSSAADWLDKEFTNMNINSLEQEEQSYKKLEGFSWGADSIN